MRLCNKNKPRHKEGATLVYVILLLCITSVLGAGVLTLTNNSVKNTSQEILNQQAYLTAKSGLNLTVNIFQDNANSSKVNEIAKQLLVEDVITSSNTIDEIDNVDRFVTNLSCAKDETNNKVTTNGMCSLIDVEVIGYHVDNSARLHAQIEFNGANGGSGFSAPYVHTGSISGNDKNVYWFDFTEEEAVRECAENQYCIGVDPVDVTNEDDKSQKLADDLFVQNNRVKDSVISYLKTFVDSKTKNAEASRGFMDVYNTYTSNPDNEFKNQYYCNWNRMYNCVLDVKDNIRLENRSTREDYYLFLPADSDGTLNLDMLKLHYSDPNTTTIGNSVYLITNAKRINITKNTYVGASLYQINYNRNNYEFVIGNNTACHTPFDFNACFVDSSKFGSEYRVSLINLYQGESEIFISGDINTGNRILNTSMWILSPNATVYYGYENRGVTASTNRFSGGIIAKNIVVDEGSQIFGVGHHFKEDKSENAELGSDFYKLLEGLGIDLGSSSSSGSSWGGVYN